MKKKIGRLALTLLLSFSTVLSACSGGSNDAGDSGSGDGKVTLSFWTLFDGGDGANMQTLVDEFNKTHPDIEVKNTKLAWGEYYTKLVTAVGNGNGPDIGISHSSRLPDL
ncbi:ABC transporter substrate-binding protein, partial [Bacillus subtilis]|uniref:ABC transporter substrate-binding protein n=2 Tax=Bacillales TaxID=1385 RepID=UPI003F7C607E